MSTGSFSSPKSPRTTYERATREYDEKFKRDLIEEIVSAIFKASMVTDANVMALRVGETTEALLSCLIATAALSTHFDTPSHLRKFAEHVEKRIRREVSKARAEGYGEKFCFGARRGGHA
jgi:hypothetical protein